MLKRVLIAGLRDGVRYGSALATPVRDLTPDALRNPANWDTFDHTRNDIVVATPYKTGTTWTQQIVSQLLRNGEASHQWMPPLADSVEMWVDFDLPDMLGSAQERAVKWDALPGRRCFKTHLHFTGIPYYAHWKYVVVLRDPRDVFMSWHNHYTELHPNLLEQACIRNGIKVEDAPRGLPAEVDAFNGLRWSMTWCFYTWANSFWEFNKLPNVHLAHYSDLKQTFDAEAKKMAKFLELSPTNWEAIATHSSFEFMKKNEVLFSPPEGMQKPGSFIHQGKEGRGKTELPPDLGQKILDACKEKCSPELCAWLIR